MAPAPLPVFTRAGAALLAGGALLACVVASSLSGADAQVPTPSVARLPRFDRVLALESVAETSANVSIADLNGDGSLDLLLVKGRHWPLRSRVLLGDGRGAIQAAYDLGSTAYRSYSGRLVDLDGDGDLDVVLSNDAPDPKLTFLNDGKGQFRPAAAYGHQEWESRNASVADLDGDGAPDIVVANRAKDAVDYVCLNRGRGRFDGECIAFAQGSATTIAPADFDHDGRIDLAVPSRDGGQGYVYLNGGRAAFARTRSIPFGPADAHMRVAEAADFDGDGALDLVTIDERRGVAIHLGQKDGTFAAGSALDNGKATPYALAVGDLNGDGQADVVVGNVEAPSTAFVNDGSGRRFVPISFGDSQGTAYGFALGDLDGNGLVDIAVARSDAPSVVYLADPPPAP